MPSKYGSSRAQRNLAALMARGRYLENREGRWMLMPGRRPVSVQVVEAMHRRGYLTPTHETDRAWGLSAKGKEIAP